MIQWVSCMALTRKNVEDIAHLARLNLTTEELERYGTQLEAILGYVEMLNQLDLEGVEPTTQVLALCDRMRKDEPQPGLTPEDVEAIAPEFKAGSVKVPRILEA